MIVGLIYLFSACYIVRRKINFEVSFLGILQVLRFEFNLSSGILYFHPCISTFSFFFCFFFVFVFIK